MEADWDAVVLTALRAVQIGVTAYAMYRIWRWCSPRDSSAAMLLPLLAVLLGLSVANLNHAGRLAAEPDLIWWAWTIYDLVLPISLIKFANSRPRTPRKFCERRFYPKHRKEIHHGSLAAGPQ